MTINADSVEYLDVCAILDGDPKEIFAKLNQFFGRFGDANGGAEARQYVKNIYRTFEDIPIRIAPTENGWQPAYLNRKINPGPATIIVTAKNVRPSLKQDIKLLDRAHDNGRIIEQSG